MGAETMAKLLQRPWFAMNSSGLTGSGTGVVARVSSSRRAIDDVDDDRAPPPTLAERERASFATLRATHLDAALTALDARLGGCRCRPLARTSPPALQRARVAARRIRKRRAPELLGRILAVGQHRDVRVRGGAGLALVGRLACRPEMCAQQSVVHRSGEKVCMAVISH